MQAGRRTSWAHSPKTFLFAAGVGLIGGIVGTAFQLGSHGLQSVLIGPGGLLEAAQRLSWLSRLLLPFGGAILAALLAYGLTRRRESQGMADVMEAVTLRRAQQLKVRATVSRALSSLALIATGGSVGREGPIVYMSASFGARFARLGRFPAARLGLFAGCGVAAGMASAYYAPFAAALFAVEVVLGNFAVDILAPVVVASVTASLFVEGLSASALEGTISGPPLYRLPEFASQSPWEYLVYVVLGIAAALGGKLFVETMRLAERGFRRLPLPALVKLPLGGLLVGLIGVWLPHVWGNGYDAVNLVLKETPLLGFVALLFLFKILATAITVGSGGSGGIFTPTLFVGTALGLLVGTGAQALLPQVVADPRHYAVVGMASVLAATTGAPIMAIFMLFEMTRETQLVMPMMLGGITATVMARMIGLESVYITPLQERGIRIPQGIEETTLTTTAVKDLMREEVVWIRDTATFDMIVGMVQKTRRDSIYVVDGSNRLVGAIRLHDIKNFLADQQLGPAVIAADLAVAVPTASPDQTVAEVMGAFDDPEVHELAVVDPVRRNVLGCLDRRDLIAHLSVEVLQEQQLRAKFVEHAGAQHYVEMPPGHALSRIPVPRDMVGQSFAGARFRNRTGLVVLTIIHNANGKETRILPEPGTILHEKDSLIVMGPADAIRKMGGQA